MKWRIFRETWPFLLGIIAPIILVLLGNYGYNMFKNRTHEVEDYAWSGGHFTGTLSNLKPNGDGKFLSPDSTIMKEGVFVDGKLSGYGIEKVVSSVLDDGTIEVDYVKYEGDWKNGKYHGKGESRYTNGIYKGDFKEGKRHGDGIYRWKNGEKYSGEWVNDNMSGHGVYEWSSGSRYDGDWLDDNKQGNGTYYYADGDYFSGHWDNDKKNGVGTLICLNGEKYVETWKEGKLVKSEKIGTSINTLNERLSETANNNYSSNSPDYSRQPTPVVKPQRCGICGGTGMCSNCGGSGVSSYGHAHRCGACDGGGRCATCMGSGVSGYTTEYVY